MAAGYLTLNLTTQYLLFHIIDGGRLKSKLNISVFFCQDDNSKTRQTPQHQQEQSLTERQKAQMAKLESECENVHIYNILIHIHIRYIILVIKRLITIKSLHKCPIVI